MEFLSDLEQVTSLLYQNILPCVPAVCVYVSIICTLVYRRQIFWIHWQHLAFNYFPSWQLPCSARHTNILIPYFTDMLILSSFHLFFSCSIHPCWGAPCNINHTAIFAPGTFERAVWFLLEHFRAGKKALPSSPHPPTRFYWGINKRRDRKGNLFLAPSKSVFKARFLALLEVNVHKIFKHWIWWKAQTHFQSKYQWVLNRLL